MSRSLIFSVLLFASISASAHIADPAYLQQLVTAARAAELADSRQWRALVHYRDNLLLPGVTGQADDPEFYLAANGKIDPAAELDATLAAFFAPPFIETDQLQHPQCRFVARYHWLSEVLHFDPARLPAQPCARFHAWRDALNAGALTLVFPSAYINNPSSMFGHTLLRVDAVDQDERTRLLGYAINYAVEPHGDGGATFIMKSLMGAYPGQFSISPYYIKVKEYSDMENRDIWEYRLNFTQEEIDRLLMHAWELGPVRFDYYFFDENCAYHLLSLFEVARPSLRLTSGFRGWVIPVDTVRRMAAQSGMVAEVVYRPANNTRLRNRLARMSTAEQALVRELAAGAVPALEGVPPARQAELLEGAYALARYQDSERRVDHVAAARTSRELLLTRSRLPAGTAIEPPMPEVRPEQGHATRRLAVGAGRDAHRDFQSLEFRPAYNDLLDPGGGYTDGAQINFMDLGLRRYQEDGNVALEKLTLVDIYSLAPRDAFFKPVSWKAATGFARVRLADGRRVGAFHSHGGAGLALGNWQGAVFYGFLEGTLDVADALHQDHAVGLGPSAGVFVRPTAAWKVHLSARLQDYISGDRYTEHEYSLQQSYSFSRDQSLRLTLARHHDRGGDAAEALLTWHWYF